MNPNCMIRYFQEDQSKTLIYILKTFPKIPEEKQKEICNRAGLGVLLIAEVDGNLPDRYVFKTNPLPGTPMDIKLSVYVFGDGGWRRDGKKCVTVKLNVLNKNDEPKVTVGSCCLELKQEENRTCHWTATEVDNNEAICFENGPSLLLETEKHDKIELTIEASPHCQSYYVKAKLEVPCNY